MTKTIPLSMVLILSTSLYANEFSDVTISATQETSVFTSAEYDNTQEFKSTLPSNMIAPANSSGIKIDGAIADFTSIYWNGIKVNDPSSINAYANFMNYGRNNSESLSVDGSNINYQSKSANYVDVQAGDNEYSRINLSRSFKGESSTHTLKLEALTQNSKTAYSAKQEVSSDEERDRESNYNFAYLSSIDFAGRYNSKIAFMHKNIDYSYDSGYPTDPNDASAKYKTLANVGGIDIGYLDNKNELKADFQYNSTDAEHFGANASTYESQVLRYGVKGATDFGLDNIKVSGSVYGVKESATILSGGYSPIDDSYAREYVDYALSFLYNYENIKLNVAYDSSYKDTNSFITSLQFPIYGGLSLIAKYEDNNVNPSIIQEVNPYGASNDNLQSQKLNRIAAGFLYERKEVTFKIDYSQIKTDDMITWVTIDPATYLGQYQNVNNTKYNFLRATLDYRFLEMFALNLDYSNISNFTSSDANLVYNLPENKGIAKLDFFMADVNAYFLASYTDKQKSYGGDIDASTVYNMGIGYNVLADLEIRADIYNLSDEYYEYAANYPQSGRIITAGLIYQY